MTASTIIFGLYRSPTHRDQLNSLSPQVPDELVIDIIKENIASPKCSKGIHTPTLSTAKSNTPDQCLFYVLLGFVLDGFPRNIAQAKALDEILAKSGTPINIVVNMQVLITTNYGLSAILIR